eukprot:223779-Pleurochrysis_carterae.AAC.1
MPPPAALAVRPSMRSCDRRRFATRDVPPLPPTHSGDTTLRARAAAAPIAASRVVAASATGAHCRPNALIATCRGSTSGSSAPTVSATASFNGRPLTGDSVASVPCALSDGTAAPRRPSKYNTPASVSSLCSTSLSAVRGIVSPPPVTQLN